MAELLATRNWISYTLSEARKIVGDLAGIVASEPQKVVQLERHSTPTALLVSYERFAPLLKALHGELEDQLRWLLLERWIGGAPAHLRAPQERDFRKLDRAVLAQLLQIDPAVATQQELTRVGLPDDLSQRLLRRHGIASAIERAEAEELYDGAEHHGNKID